MFKIPTIKVKRTLLPGLVTIWLYSGFVRLYLFPQFAQIIYFLPYAILALITLRLFFQEAIQKSYYFLYLCLLFSSLIFQSVHIMFGNIDFKIAIYGLSLYIIPLALITQMPLSAKCNSNHKCERIILNSVIPNFILVVLQTLNSSPRYLPTLDNTEHLESANGVVRAFGTFSSTSGFSFYLTLCTAILLGNSNTLRRGTVYVYMVLLCSMYILSGSRTVFFALFFLLFFCSIFGEVNFKKILKFGNLFQAVLIAGCIYVLLKLYFNNVYTAFLMRLTSASSQEDTFARVRDSIFGFASQDTKSPIGQGFGSRSIGSYSYSVTNGWIENDLPRIVAESGISLGIAIIFGRWVFLAWLLYTQTRHERSKQFYRSLLIGTIFPVLLFGQFMGQGSVRLGTWISIYLCFALSPHFRRQKA